MTEIPVWTLMRNVRPIRRIQTNLKKIIESTRFTRWSKLFGDRVVLLFYPTSGINMSFDKNQTKTIKKWLNYVGGEEQSLFSKEIFSANIELNFYTSLIFKIFDYVL